MKTFAEVFLGSIIALSISVPAHAGPAGNFDAAEQRLAACMTRAESGEFPPYMSDLKRVYATCAQEKNAYIAACRQMGQSSFDCDIAAGTLADNVRPKPNQVDERFVDCLERAAEQTAPGTVLTLLTMCRQDRYGYELDCQQRGYNAAQCHQKSDSLACATIKLVCARGERFDCPCNISDPLDSQ